MNELDDDASLDDALRQQWQHGGEPADAGFSLRVMATLQPQLAPRQRRWARAIRWAQWLAASLAACAAATLLAGPLDGPHALAAAALLGLLIFWSIPNRWSGG